MAELTRIYFSVTNDLVGDQRVHRIISTLQRKGASVCLVGRKKNNSLPLDNREYETYRLRMLFEKGFLFYACFNLRLFLFLLFRRKIDILVANDLDTLPANYIISKIRKTILIYDSHEYFTEVPELIGRERVRNFWLIIERKILPALKNVYTVSQPIADAYSEKYGVEFEVIHNYPLREKSIDSYKLPFATGGDKLLIYQGAVNMGRGLEILIDAVAEMDGVKLIIAGDGDIRNSLGKKVTENNLESKIILLGKIPFKQLHSLTRIADAGVSLEEDMGLNYRFAMPNKLFDYIQAGIPVLVSDLPEMKKIVEEFKIGMIAVSRDREAIKKLLTILLFDEKQRAFWKQGIEKAAIELCWENEEGKLIGIFKKAGCGF